MLCCVKQNEIDCLRKRNCRIRNANHILKLTLKNLMDNPYQECDKLLESVATMCKKKCPDVSCIRSCDPCFPLCTSNSCRYSSCPPVSRSVSPGRYSFCSTTPKSPCCYPSCPSLCVCGTCCPPKICSPPVKCYCQKCVDPCCYSTVRKLPNYCCKPLCCKSPCCKPQCFKPLCCKPLCCKPTRPLCSPCSPCSSPKSFGRSKSCSPICCPPVKTCFCCSPCKTDPCQSGQSRIGAGCSTGGCGGYTPSGWNKLMTKARLLCDDKPCGCCSPACTCTECLCTAVRRKPKCRKNICTDFCNSQTSPQDESASNNKNRPSLKLLGELAFQLERRILDYVFGMEDSKRRRFYGYTVSNIFSMMEKESKSPKGGSDVITKSELAGRLKKLLTALEKYGYNIKIHAEFAQEMVNKYGLLSCPPDESTIEQFGLNDGTSIACLIQQLAQGPSEISNFNILLNCLKYLSKCDKRPLFMW